MYDTIDDYIIIYEINGGGGYDWAIDAVLYHPQRMSFFMYSDGGCSCDYPYIDGWEEYIEGPFSRDQIHKKLIELRKGNMFGYTQGDVQEAIQALHNFNPVKAVEQSTLNN